MVADTEWLRSSAAKLEARVRIDGGDYREHQSVGHGDLESGMRVVFHRGARRCTREPFVKWDRQCFIQAVYQTSCRWS